MLRYIINRPVFSMYCMFGLGFPECRLKEGLGCSSRTFYMPNSLWCCLTEAVPCLDVESLPFWRNFCAVSSVRYSCSILLRHCVGLANVKIKTVCIFYVDSTQNCMSWSWFQTSGTLNSLLYHTWFQTYERYLL